MKLTFEKDILLAPYTTLGIGGKARYFCRVKDRDQLQEAVKKASDMNLTLTIIGRGSNVFFPDEGFDGLVIINQMNQIQFQQTSVIVESGYSFAYLGLLTAKHHLSGLEFAAGIPGSVGGAIFMNAGAAKQETKDCLVSCLVLNQKQELQTMVNKDLDFAYRYSSLQQQGGFVVEATFALKNDAKAREYQKMLLRSRLGTQPYHEKSCGCVFRNPEGGSAGQLIDQCGLKGFSIGDVFVSEKHANFLINRGSATAKQMQELITYIQKVVYEQTGCMLELEAKPISNRGNVIV